jgi:hypothetical protein
MPANLPGPCLSSKSACLCATRDFSAARYSRRPMAASEIFDLARERRNGGILLTQAVCLSKYLLKLISRRL